MRWKDAPMPDVQIVGVTDDVMHGRYVASSNSTSGTRCTTMGSAMGVHTHHFHKKVKVPFSRESVKLPFGNGMI